MQARLKMLPLSAVWYGAADPTAASIASVGRPVSVTAPPTGPVTASVMFTITAPMKVLPTAQATAPVTVSVMALAQTTVGATT